MTKVVLSNVANLQDESSATNTINVNSGLVSAAFDNTLSRDGTSPNQMVANLDMNSNQVINLPAATFTTSPVRKAEFDQAVFGTGNGNVVGPAGATAGAIAVYAGTTGQSISQITVVPVSQGGTNGSTAATARTNLGVAIGSNVQAWDTDLDAYAALSSAGLVSRTGSGTASVRTLTGTTGQLTVTNGDGVSGNPTLTIGAIPSFLVHKNGTDQTTISDVTPTALTWSTEVFDIGSFFTSNTWTPPAGKVMLTGSAYATGTLSITSFHKLILYKNASPYKQTYWFTPSASNGIGMTINMVDVATGSDAYQLWAFIDVTASTGTVKGTTTDTFFSGHWISP